MKGVADIYPLAPSQLGILFDALRHRDPELYFEQVRFDLVGDIDLNELRRAWTDTIDRHPALRTIWLWEGLDDPVQVVRTTVDLPWVELDWRSEIAADEALDVLAHDDRQRGFDLTRPPVMRVTVVRVTDDRIHVVWSFHHIMLDGWSTALVLEEVLDRCAGGDVAPSRPFRDHVAWIASQDSDDAEQYWRARLDGFDQPTRLASDRGSSDADFQLARTSVSLDRESTARLVAAARDHRVTTNTLVQAAWATVLSCHSGDDDVVFGVTGAGRPSELDGVESMVGMFLSTLPMRVRFDGDDSVSSLWSGIQAQQLDLTQYQYSSLADVARWSQVPPGLPLFETALVFENYPRSRGSDRPFAVEGHRVFEQTRFPLTVMIGPGDHLEALALFDESRFDAASVDELLAGFVEVIDQMSTTPGRNLRSVSVLTEATRRRLLVDMNRTDRPVPSTTVPAEIERCARAQPDSPALIDGERTWTFQELLAAADRIAGSVRAEGVGRGEPVVVSIPRSAETVIALLATMRAGAAYVALEPATPADRRRAIIEGAAPSLAITTAAGLTDFAESGIAAIDVAAAGSAGAGIAGDRPIIEATADDPMFVVFTSGSTGRPKGVPGTHRAVINRCRWQHETYPFGDDEIACQKTTLDFVDHVAELWAPLAAGRPVVIVPDRVVRDPDAFVSALGHHEIRRIVMVPSLLDVLLDTIDDLAERLPRLALWTLSGEVLSRSLADRFRAAMPNATLLNVYGMSEVMADATCFDGRSDDVEEDAEEDAEEEDVEESVPIGRPIDNLRVYVLDRVGRPTPPGVPGQIWISGVGVTSGYWRRDDLTSERICSNPFGDGDHGRRYATGDIGRWRDDGQLVYLGRLDRQVKVRGMRVELGDIEAAIRGLPEIRDVVVVDASAEHEHTRLVAHVVADGELDVVGARRQLADRVPDHLVPSELNQIDSIPLLPSGKIDHQALARVVTARQPIVDGPLDEDLVAMISTWKDVIGTGEIGPDDDFFDVGGHSIAGMRLLSRIKRDHDVNLELSVLYSDPTPRTLLRRVRAIAAGGTTGGVDHSFRHLVPIAPGDDDRRTWYCVHGAGGNVLNFRDLALALSPEWRTVGIQASGVDGVTPPHSTLDEMCEAYISEVIADRPEGPLFLAGFSGGGIIAYEMAVRLAARGRPVAAVVLLDTFHRSIEGRRRTVREHAAALWRNGPSYLLERREVRRQRRLYARADEIVQNETPNDGAVPHELRDAQLVANVRTLLDDYDTPHYDGPVWLFAASDVLDVFRHAGPDRGWRRSASDLRCEPVPGGHDDFILEPHVHVLAERLQSRLEQAVAAAVPDPSGPSERSSR